MFRTLLLSAAFITLLATPLQAKDIHVSPFGDDRNAGTRSKPIRSLDSALSRIANTSKSTIWLASGTYQRSKTLAIGKRHNKLTLRAEPNADVHITGAARIPVSSFKKVSAVTGDKRIRNESLPHILVADLKALGIKDYGVHQQYGHSISVPTAPLELFIDAKPLTLARYPNSGNVLIGKVIDTGSIPRTGDYSERGGTFTYTDPRHAAWVGETDVWLQGTFNYGFADDFLNIKEIDPSKKTITLRQPHLYGLGAGQPYQQYVAHNILQELDEPGEWYIDRTAGKLYLWPQKPLLKSSSIEVSTLDTPLVCIENAAGVTVQDITFEATRGIGVYMEGGRNNRIEHCTIRNVGNTGIFMGQGARQTFPHTTVDDYTGVPASRMLGNLQGHIYNDTVWDRKAGTGHRIVGCDIYNTGSGGIVLSGGSKKWLTPGDNTVDGCRIHDYNRRNKFLWAGINVDGCGNTVRRCEIYNSNCQGIYVHGNEHVFEYNNIHDVTLDSNDTSPWYVGRDPSDRGNVVRWNYFHHIGNPARMTMGIYCDDSSTGVTVYGNVFYKMATTHGVLFSNSGWDLKMTGNLIIDPIAASFEISAHYYTWAAAEAPQMFGPKGLLRKRLRESVDITKPPYSTRYPELLTYLDEIIPGKEWQGMRSRGNVFSGNVIVGGPKQPVSLLGGATSKVDISNNWQTSGDPGCVDFAAGNFALRSDARAFVEVPGFVAPPFAKMGLSSAPGPRTTKKATR